MVLTEVISVIPISRPATKEVAIPLVLVILFIKTAMDDRVYRAMVATIQNFNLSINRVSSPTSI